MDVGNDFTELLVIKDEQSDTLNKDRQHEKYGTIRIEVCVDFDVEDFDEIFPDRMNW